MISCLANILKVRNDADEQAIQANESNAWMMGIE